MGRLVHQEGSRAAGRRREVGLQSQQVVRQTGIQAAEVLRVQIQAGQSHPVHQESLLGDQIQDQDLRHPEQDQSGQQADRVQPVEQHRGLQRELQQCSDRQLRLQVA